MPNQATNQKPEFPFTIGADPELNIVTREKKVNAQKLLMKLYKEDHDMTDNDDGFVIRTNNKKFGSIGWDGHPETAEIRPEPSKSPYEVVENIKHIMTSLSEKIKLFDLNTLSEHGAIGGHIHLGIRNLLDSSNRRNEFHRKLASFYLPILQSQNLVNIQTRMAGGIYGDINDFRVENETYEFRTPTAEWLITPDIAVATLTYIATVAHEIINHPRNFNKAKEVISSNRRQNKNAQDFILSGHPLFCRELTKEVKKHIKTFEFYEPYKKEIDFVLSNQRIVNEKKKAEYLVNKGWSIFEIKSPTKRDLLNEKKCNESTSKINIDIFKNFTDIYYNDDEGVAGFASAIQKRIIGYNWKMNHTYFLFGLRKQIPGFSVYDFNHDLIYHDPKITNAMDVDKLKQIHNNMIDKFYDRLCNNSNSMSRNYINKFPEKYLVVGIPYDLRLEQNTKPFIELVHALEKGTLKKKEITTTTQTQDQSS